MTSGVDVVQKLERDLLDEEPLGEELFEDEDEDEDEDDGDGEDEEVLEEELLDDDGDDEDEDEDEDDGDGEDEEVLEEELLDDDGDGDDEEVVALDAAQAPRTVMVSPGTTPLVGSHPVTPAQYKHMSLPSWQNLRSQRIEEVALAVVDVPVADTVVASAGKSCTGSGAAVGADRRITWARAWLSDRVKMQERIMILVIERKNADMIPGARSFIVREVVVIMIMVVIFIVIVIVTVTVIGIMVVDNRRLL